MTNPAPSICDITYIHTTVCRFALPSRHALLAVTVYIRSKSAFSMALHLYYNLNFASMYTLILASCPPPPSCFAAPKL